MSVVFSSQSLFHQVCVRSHVTGQKKAGPAGRNPFFIRSVFVRFRSRRKQAGEGGRNPFFIRSVFVRLVSALAKRGYTLVAIPFSSGLCSFTEEANFAAAVGVAIPFSSGLCSFRLSCNLHRHTKVAIPFSSGLCSFFKEVFYG